MTWYGMVWCGVVEIHARTKFLVAFTVDFVGPKVQHSECRIDADHPGKRHRAIVGYQILFQTAIRSTGHRAI